MIATCGAGVLLMLMGIFRLGNLVRFVPVSIIIGFTNGIAVLIALSQLKDALGLPIAKMPGDFFGQMQAIGSHLNQWNPTALGLAIGCLALLFIWPYLLHQKSPIQRFDGVTVRTFARLPAPGGGAADLHGLGLLSAPAGRNYWQPLWQHSPKNCQPWCGPNCPGTAHGVC